MALNDRDVRRQILQMRNARLLQGQLNVPISYYGERRFSRADGDAEADRVETFGYGRKQGRKDREDEKLAMEVKGVKDHELEGGMFAAPKAVQKQREEQRAANRPGKTKQGESYAPRTAKRAEHHASKAAAAAAGRSKSPTKKKGRKKMDAATLARVRARQRKRAEELAQKRREAEENQTAYQGRGQCKSMPARQQEPELQLAAPVRAPARIRNQVANQDNNAAPAAAAGGPAQGAAVQRQDAGEVPADAGEKPKKKGKKVKGGAKPKRKLSEKMKKRNALVKKIMKERGVKLIEASKIVKREGLM